MITVIKLKFYVLIAVYHTLGRKLFEERPVTALRFFPLSDEVESKAWAQIALLH